MVVHPQTGSGGTATQVLPLFKQDAPSPDGALRQAQALQRRLAALLVTWPSVTSTPNGEMDAFQDCWPTNFTKGLKRDAYGVVDSASYRTYFAALSKPDYVDGPSGFRSKFDVPGYKDPFLTKAKDGTEWKWRGWESPLAGHQFEVAGPDPASVGMAPAPRLGSDELAAEMAEVYAMALLRDVPLEDLRDGEGLTGEILAALQAMPWFDPAKTPKTHEDKAISAHSHKRRKRDGGALTAQTLFRGSSKGCADGPYLSQFLLQGTRGLDGAADARKGQILYGAQRIDQRVERQKPHVDYLRSWPEFLDVQNGANTRRAQQFDGELVFMTTPRDLATYVHYDALYQGYLNACLMLQAWGHPGDRGMPEPNGKDTHTRDPFATFGGPHVLTLVTETCSRALRAVRRQKFLVHNRARPEAMGLIATLAANGEAGRLGPAQAAAERHLALLRQAKAGSSDLLEMVRTAPVEKHFSAPGKTPFDPACNLLLPMAFPEGSPMHPAYGAGHATVAGSCVTILKAFFEMYRPDGTEMTLADANPGGEVLVPDPKTGELVPSPRGDKPSDLTLQGELNKLASNIAIGRNMAGVHYYSDYFDSVRMGERVAVGILLEQMTAYSESVTVTFDSFDDDRIVIGGDGKGGAWLSVNGETAADKTTAWWVRHLGMETAALTS